MLMTLLLFAVISAVTVVAWNWSIGPVPWRYTIVIAAAVMTYEGAALFSRNVDFPGPLAYAAYPWKALGGEPVRANTGIAFSLIGPWTEAGRDSLKAGVAPLWNRRLGSGIPLISGQESAILHPFTLAGLWLPLGKAMTLSAALRLFFLSFFTFAFLRGYDLHDHASLFGSLAYGFATFHIVWLQMPLSLAAAMLPLALAATRELLVRPSMAAFAWLTAGLGMTLLAGHPETEFFVALTVGAYALATARSIRRLLLAAAAAIAAMLVTAFAWLPFISVLPLSERHAQMSSTREHPPIHHIGAPWLMTLVAPDLLGTAPGGTYKPPEPRAGGDLLDDYGEISSGYAGLTTLALAFAALPLVRRRPLAAFAIGAMVVALATMAEVPGWRGILRQLPLLGLALTQRFRMVWNLGVVCLAAIGLDALIRGEMKRRRLVLAAAATAALLAAAMVAGLPLLLARGVSAVEIAQLFAPAVVLAVAVALPIKYSPVTAVLVFAELVFVTWHYNPVCSPEDVYPMTGAIRAMQAGPLPHRILATGWSLLPDTPGAYGLEDVKTTDPMTQPEYRRLVDGYLHASGWDEVVGTTHYPFIDFLNVRYIYVPPGGSPLREDVVPVYHGADGTVFRNDHALPRYFFPRSFALEPSFSKAVARLKEIPDFHERALVDEVPSRVRAQASDLARAATLGPVSGGGGSIRIVRYGFNETDLDVDSSGWNLLATSDSWWPGWRVYIGDQRWPHVRVNGAFLGTFIPPGHAIVRLRYAPSQFAQGVRISVATLALLVIAGVWLRRRRFAAVF